METFTYRPKGVCSQLMEITVDGDTVVNLNVIGGCDGNLQGIGKLVEGMPIDEVITRLAGIRCGWKETSCPDQLSIALKSLKAERSDA